MPHVISTGSSDVNYTEFRKTVENKDIRQTVVRQVLVKGGQGVMRRKELFTPYNGVVTEITDEEAEFLLRNEAFKRHMERGFVRIVNYHPDDKRASKELQTMEKEDDSAQLTPGDFAAEAAAVAADGAELKIAGKKVEAGNKVSRKRSK